MAGEVYLDKTVPRGTNERAEKDRKQLSSFDRIGPRLDLMRLDGEKRRYVAADRYRSLLLAPPFPVALGLTVKELLLVGTDGRRVTLAVLWRRVPLARNNRVPASRASGNMHRGEGASNVLPLLGPYMPDTWFPRQYPVLLTAPRRGRRARFAAGQQGLHSPRSSTHRSPVKYPSSTVTDYILWNYDDLKALVHVLSQVERALSSLMGSRLLRRCPERYVLSVLGRRLGKPGCDETGLDAFPDQA